MQNNNQQQILYAGFLVRLWAYIIDCIIVGCAMLIIRIPMFIISLFFPNAFLFQHILFKFSVVDIFIYLCSATYFIFMTYKFGATLGKKAMKIKVCKELEEKLSLIDVIYRETIGRYLSGLILCIGYILIAVDNRKRALHDMLCDTVVIYDFSVKHPEPICNEIIIPENNDDIQGSM